MAQNTLIIPLHNGVMLGYGPEVAGISNILASTVAGNATGEDYKQGKEEYARSLEKARGEHPAISAVLEGSGYILPALAIEKLIKGGFGVAAALRNGLQINRGAKQLERALRTQEYTDKPIFAGRMEQERIDAINEMLRKQGGLELESNKLLWPKESQEHLYIRRILHDKMTPKDVADIQKEVFFGKESEVFNNAKTHPETGALKAKHNEGEIRGHLQNEEGNTIGKTVFLRKRKR